MRDFIQEDVVKCDLIIPFHNDQSRWSIVEQSVEGNFENINKIILVSDGKYPDDWTSPETLHGVPVQSLWISKYGFGAARCRNRGSEASKERFICFTQPNMLIHPGSLASNLAILLKACSNSPTVVAGLIDEWVGTKHIPGDSRLSSPVHKLRKYRQFRTGYLFFPREELNSIGGFYEGFCAWGRGFEDYELGARWLRKYGFDSIVLGTGWSSHFSSPLSYEDYLKRMPHYPARSLFSISCLPLFDYKIKLWAEGTQREEECFNIEHGYGEGGGLDVRLDCLFLDWLPDGTCSLIKDPLPITLFPQNQIYQHLKIIVGKLAVGGELELTLPLRYGYSADYIRQIVLGGGIEEDTVTEESEILKMRFVRTRE
jgi:hypothetical protein